MVVSIPSANLDLFCGSRSPLGAAKGKSGDGEEISATVTRPYVLAEKWVPLPYDLLEVMGLPL